MRCPGDGYAAGFADLLQARRDIDAVAEDVIALDGDIAQVNPNAEADGSLVGDAVVPLDHTFLNADAAFDGGDNAGKLQQQAIAHRLDDAPAMFGDQGVDQFGAVRAQSAERTGFVRTHKTRIADNVSGYDGREPALGPLRHGGSVAVATCGIIER